MANGVLERLTADISTSCTLVRAVNGVTNIHTTQTNQCFHKLKQSWVEIYKMLKLQIIVAGCFFFGGGGVTLPFLGHKSSSQVKIRLHTENQFPRTIGPSLDLIFVPWPS